MKTDVLIIGQGLAGTLLADHLLDSGASVHVIHDPDLSSSSRVAGGMINPVTGKHLAKTWMVDQLFPYLKNYYKRKEKELDSRFYYEIPLYRPFKNEQQKQQFIQAIQKHGLEDWCFASVESKYPENLLFNPLGGIETKGSGRLDVSAFLDTMAHKWLSEDRLSYRKFNCENLSFTSEGFTYEGIQSKRIVFCEGFHGVNNPFFSWLPFNPVKGETLDILLPDQKIDEIINQGVWIMPLENEHYKLGATYSWHELNDQPTEKARNELLTKINSLVKTPVIPVSHKAGVRPATKDRRPFLGEHPENKNMFVFNGLGTKGVSLGPFFAKEMTEYLLNGKELNSETTIERFYPLYWK
jgi:glycine oxidase